MMYTIFFYLSVFYVSSNVHPRLLAICCTLRKSHTRSTRPPTELVHQTLNLDPNSSLPIPSGMCDVTAHASW
ncbi:hypothetical protein CGRA01v4_07450 [Colletotrichum graminicola]|nr:hypothetical protein CGRA01v4_07450 [Colletotrichum graminicola]